MGSVCTQCDCDRSMMDLQVMQSEEEIVDAYIWMEHCSRPSGFVLYSKNDDYDEDAPWAGIIADALPEAVEIVGDAADRGSGNYIMKEQGRVEFCPEVNQKKEQLNAEWCPGVNQQLGNSGVSVDAISWKVHTSSQYGGINTYGGVSTYHQLAIRVRIP
eukprot:gnl/TRDRNA2_/TRDRNA2_175979_c2_seq6.p2 gnl/TRDRNA2_/TRDRNA2_175979_c2~~gnl/TRDRNA2_/TRDRNA2_175979_c2_seq6.p2  ORF type:complete len:159 (-),score=20.71 gnl/TRDRNA2_/TRDRNA2_175979_c2_seq6:512-988(-)